MKKRKNEKKEHYGIIEYATIKMMTRREKEQYIIKQVTTRDWKVQFQKQNGKISKSQYNLD